MATYTPNYGLHQWEAGDNFLRTDFNADFSKIDTALGSKAGLVTGSYTGDGEASQTISLGFTPRAVLLLLATGHISYNGSRYGGLAFPDAPVTNDWEDASSGTTVLAIVEGGFQVYYDYEEDVFTNFGDYLFRYLALR